MPPKKAAKSSSVRSLIRRWCAFALALSIPISINANSEKAMTAVKRGIFAAVAISRTVMIEFDEPAVAQFRPDALRYGFGR